MALLPAPLQDPARACCPQHRRRPATQPRCRVAERSQVGPLGHSSLQDRKYLHMPFSFALSTYRQPGRSGTGCLMQHGNDESSRQIYVLNSSILRCCLHGVCVLQRDDQSAHINSGMCSISSYDTRPHASARKGFRDAFNDVR